ncbi:MAG: hypothetical protein JKX70_11980 [Phycisphaerales bacterium]|nr:hypothetical protein [Phycisphaerales bacterium]
MNRKQMLLWGFLGFIVLAMVGGAVAVLFPRWRFGDEMLGSIILTGFYVLGGMALMIYGRRMPMTRGLSLVGLIVSLVFFLVGIWFNRPLSWRWESIVFSSGSISFALAGGLAHRVFVWPIKTRGLGGSVLKWSSVVFSLAMVGMIVFGFANEGTGYWGRGYLRVMWISVILTTGTTIATGMLALFGSKPGDDEPGVLGSTMLVSMTCPRCGVIVEAQSNRESRCSGCRLKIRVEVEEPRCSCGYLLYQLEADTCPECGKAIAADDRWGNEDRG